MTPSDTCHLPPVTSSQSDRYILTLACRDVRGIVAAVTGFLSDNFGFIIESAQFGDASTGTFFMRVEFSLEPGGKGEVLRQRFDEQIAQRFSMQWRIDAKEQKSRVLILVSKYGHCLNDLLYRYRTGQLAIDIPAIVSNHSDMEGVAKWHGIPFYHLPQAPSLTLPPSGRGDNEAPSPAKAGEGRGGGAVSKAAQEAKILDIITRERIDVTVLARYMQILSPELCHALQGRAINIHHSFLPSFKGARPYQQAFDRGVKLIGATAHYVTTDLDEGPIIEQEVARVDHTQQAEDLAAIGHDIECLVLARALKYHIEHRVLLNGSKTVVFR